MEKGLIHLYTGEGKGKTTAAAGLAVRALSHGLSVCYINFNKGIAADTTELNGLRKLGANIIVGTGKHPDFDKNVSPQEHSNETSDKLKYISGLIKQHDYDVLILDEILISVRDGFITEEDMVDFINNKPEGTELVLTGRGATDEIIKLADYVSNINCVKHPFNEGINAREGIEY